METIFSSIYQTWDYDKFKFMEGNRNIDQKHLQKVKRSLLEKQLPIPIIVNEKFEILEGQHRYTAIKEEKLPLYYMVVEGVTIQDAININTISKGWKAQDYFKFYLDLGYEQYKNLAYFMEVTGMNLFDARLFMEGYSNASTSTSFSTGKFVGVDFSTAMDRYEKYNDFRGAQCFNHRSFKVAVMKLFASEQYEHERMKEQLAKGLISELTIRTNMIEYIKVLTYIYNVNRTKKNLVHFNVDSQGKVMAMKV